MSQSGGAAAYSELLWKEGASLAGWHQYPLHSLHNVLQEMAKKAQKSGRTLTSGKLGMVPWMKKFEASFLRFQ